MMTGSKLSSFGSLLQGFRKRSRLTQQQLATAIGVHRNAIVRWEQGDFLPKHKGTILELAKHLHLDDQEARQLLEASFTALAPFWGVPLPRNPLFTGREEILTELHQHLGVQQEPRPTQSLALYGLGGIGKTQVVLEYAYRYALEYSAILWIAAETHEHAMSSVLRIAELLRLVAPEEADNRRIVTAAQSWLTTHSQWLLILDNVEDVELFQHWLPATRQGSILLTTRRQALGSLAQGMELASMPREEGALFVLRRAKVLGLAATNKQMYQLAVSRPTEYATASELVMAMGGVPLALDQAGAYVEETGCSLCDYLQRYKHQRVHLLSRRGVPAGDYPHSVTATFKLAHVQVEQEQSAAADLLRVCAFLHADAIPEELFVTGAAHLETGLALLSTDPSWFDQAIAVLRSLSLVQRYSETKTLSIHRLVQTVLREEMGEQEQAHWQIRTLHLLHALFPEVTYNSWKLCERYLAHVLACAATIPEQRENLLLAELLWKVADYLHERAQYEPAEPLYLRVLRIFEREHGPEHPTIARLLNMLALLYIDQGKQQQAEALLERTLRILEKTLGPEHPDIARPLTNRAILLAEQGKYELAELLYCYALRIWEQAWGPEDPGLAHLLYGLADLYQEQGKYEPAEALFQRTLCILEQAWGPEHPHLGHPLNGLALLSLKQGRYCEAEAFCQRALYLWEQTVGLEHPYVASSLTILAQLCLEQKQYKRGEQLCQRALQLQEQTIGPEHRDLVDSLTTFTQLFLKQREYEQAHLLFQRAIRICEHALGDTHPKTIATQLLYTQHVQEMEQH